MAHHVRHSSNHAKRALPAHAKPTKPAPLSKRSSSHGSKGSRKVDLPKDLLESDEEEAMAVSFLNYCTVCEKQIVTPSNAVLYCSESCKKKDTEKSLTYSYDHYSPPTTPFANFTFDDFQFRDIIPQRSPTQSHSKRSSCAFSDDLSDDNTTPSDEKSQRLDSEASRYLRQFQSSTYSPETTRPVRPHYSSTSTSQFSFGAAPSLSHTPTSSYSFSLPYTPYTSATTRPLPPRTNPHTSSYASKSIDLVTPLTAPSSPKQYSYKAPPISRTSASTIEGELVYAKSPVPSMSPANGSLGRLLASKTR
ncbi:hypothetical protein P153DRAFT_369463 [Dothidotthia symphoricarpi CBS 119687]|uniref:Life-span regulatory factor-domain-containing protein n=1 Tax=Dothidotthia symphoricarpi CBS 119687 TaxID=1392245 RepID=A0A6A6A5R0_9PLEO|nr:uncharacterized protein P153DRAFT_369463 [Dothidotthia symphoricarpi CBS 119687]KAF2126108.1 hypothetical protein P153DRAFT_369463 [Dothidotthia symphoricarpi CBS 119687]